MTYLLLLPSSLVAELFHMIQSSHLFMLIFLFLFFFTVAIQSEVFPDLVSTNKYIVSTTGHKVRYLGIKPLHAPTFSPTIGPTFQVVCSPSINSISRSVGKIITATSRPTSKPAKSTSSPTFKFKPTVVPSQRPLIRPSTKPTIKTSVKPSTKPTCKPKTAIPTIPSVKPTKSPSLKLTSKPMKSSPPSKSSSPSKSSPSSKSSSPSKSSPPSKSSSPSKSFPPSKSAPTASIQKSLSPSTAPTASPFTDMKYRYQPLLTTQPLVLYNIYYGDFQSTTELRATKTLMDYFSTYLGQTDWFKILYSYYEIIGNTKKYISQPSVFGKSTTYMPTAKGLTIGDADLQKVIMDSINQNKVPYNANGLYTVIFRGDFKFDGWLTEWCGYHAGFNTPSGEFIAYSVVGDPGTISDPSLIGNCAAWAPPTANKNVGADSMISVYAHEVAEALTDAYGAWFMDDQYGAENGDACAWDFGLPEAQSNMKIGNRSVLVQQLWKPGFGCTMSVNVPTMAPTFWSKHNWAGPPTFAPAILPTVSPNFQSDVSYHGGPVLTGQVNLYNIYVGDFTSSASGKATQSLVDFFATYIGSSPWYNVLTNYYQLDGTKKTFVSNFAHFNSSTILFPTASAMNLTDDDLKLAIANAMAAAQIPIDEKGIYTVILRGNFNLVYKGLKWPADFCSYHSAFYTPDLRLIKYVVVGDPSTNPAATNCIPISDGPTVNGNLGGDSIVAEYAKNLADTVTGYLGAWYSNTTKQSSGYSCGDKYGTVNVNWNVKVGGKAFLIPQVWQPSVGCVSASVSFTATPTIAPSLSPTLLPRSDIAYYGGAVITGPINLYNVYLGDFNSTAALRNGTALVDYFTSHIGGSDWFNVLTAYYKTDSATNLKTYVSNNVKLVASITSPLKGGPTPSNEATFQNILKKLITTGRLPAADANGVYNLIFRGDLSVAIDGLGVWGVDWCSIHGTTTLTTTTAAKGTVVQTLKYTLSGDPATLPAAVSTTAAAQLCLPPSNARPTANRHLGADSIVSELANSLAGAVTNSDNSGWYFSDFSDAGDACFRNYGAYSGNSNVLLGSKRFLIQQNWLPKYGCRMTK